MLFIRERINQILMVKKNNWVYVNFSYYFLQRQTMRSLAKINSFTFYQMLVFAGWLGFMAYLPL